MKQEAGLQSDIRPVMQVVSLPALMAYADKAPI